MGLRNVLGKKEDHLKILIIGLPKTGTSILTYKIADHFKDHVIHFEPGKQNGLNDYEFHKKVCLRTNKPVITKNLYYYNHPNRLQEIISLYDKVVWINRDPRDRLISEFFYRWNKGHNPDTDKFERSLKRVQKKEKQPMAINFFQLVQGFNNSNPFQFTLNQVRNQMILLSEFDKVKNKLFVYKYEDLIDKRFGRLEEYLGFQVSYESDLPDKLERVVRSKKYGNWRNWFTEDDCTFFRGIYYEFLLKMDYDPEDWTLNKNQQIDPKEGSEYMKRIFYKK